MIKDELEDFWADVRPKGVRPKKPAKPLRKAEKPIKGVVWVGLFGPDGQELSCPGYERVPMDIPTADESGRMVFPVHFTQGFNAVVESIGVWETQTGGQLIHRTTTTMTVHLRETDTLNLDLTITDTPHPYGGIRNMLKMRGLL